MNGRVTIVCEVGCDQRAVEMHTVFTERGSKRVHDYPCCVACRARSRLLDQTRITDNDPGASFLYAWLINPGAATEDDVLAVECSIDAIGRLLRAAAGDERELGLLAAACEAHVGVVYEPCWKGPPDRSCSIGGWRHEACNGWGFVLRRDARERLEVGR